MRKHILINTCLKYIQLGVVILMVTLGIVTSCDSDKVDNLYTFEDKMMGQYLKDSASVFSEFNTLLDTTKVMGLLNGYGSYTCFAPTNEAMRTFYKSKGKKSLSEFPMDSLMIMAYDHIINGTVIKYANFVNGSLPATSMSDRYFSISYDSIGRAYINDAPKIVNNITYHTGSKIIQKDITVHNGVIHIVNKILNPSRAGIVAIISKDTLFTVFYQALIATGLGDSLLLDKDKTYDPNNFKDLVTVTKDQNQWFYFAIPASRRYGYTVLMESNKTLKANGITDLASMRAYAASVYDEVYPADKGITEIRNRRNSLNRFIAYHLLNKQLSYTKFIDAYDTDHMLKTRDMYEYLEPMCPNTLIEVKKQRTTNMQLINLTHENGKYIQIVLTNKDKEAINGFYHEINDMLVYSKDVDNELSTKRLRFDAASFFPELTNNNMRGLGMTDPNLKFQLPKGYVSRISSSAQTIVQYLTPYKKYQDYEGDEIYLKSSAGNLYDFTIITPPVPAGTYEVRFGYLTNGQRGVAQLYLDNVPAGVPLNLNNYSSDPSIGYIEPHSGVATSANDYEGFENDKMMRNRGFMKGPASFKVPVTGWSSGENARYSTAALRKIMGTYTFTTAANHSLTVTGLSGGEFMFDYLEFVPTSALETEDIY